MRTTASHRTSISASAITVALLAVGTLGAAPAAQAAPGDVTEFSVAPGQKPADIAVGADGNMWFTGAQSSTIGRITTAGVVTTFSVPTAASVPNGITAGPDGNMWFTETVGNNIGRITPAGAVTEFAIPTANAQPAGIAAGSDGALWFTESAGNKIGRITTSGAVTEYSLPSAASVPYGITPGPTGSDRLYFTQSGGARIGTVTVTGNVANAAALDPGALPVGITVVNGSVWFVEMGWNNLDRLVNDTTPARIPLGAGVSPWDVIPGPGSTIWITAQGTDNVLKFSDQGSPQATIALPTAASDPGGLVVGPDGNIWVTEMATHKIARIASGQLPVSTGAPTITPTTSNAPGSVLTAANGTWNYQPSGYTYQWQSCPSGEASCSAIPGAVAQTYTAQAADNGKQVRVGVAAVNLSGTSAPAFSALVSVGAATPPTPTPPGPATGPMVSIGSGVTAQLVVPARQRRATSAAYQVIFTSAAVSGNVTFTFTDKGKSKTVTGAVGATGSSRITFKVPKAWKKGRMKVNASFVPSAGSPFNAGNMVATVKVT